MGGRPVINLYKGDTSMAWHPFGIRGGGTQKAKSTIFDTQGVTHKNKTHGVPPPAY